MSRSARRSTEAQQTVDKRKHLERTSDDMNQIVSNFRRSRDFLAEQRRSSTRRWPRRHTTGENPKSRSIPSNTRRNSSTLGTRRGISRSLTAKPAINEVKPSHEIQERRESRIDIVENPASATSRKPSVTVPLPATSKKRSDSTIIDILSTPPQTPTVDTDQSDVEQVQEPLSHHSRGSVTLWTGKSSTTRWTIVAIEAVITVAVIGGIWWLCVWATSKKAPLDTTTDTSRAAPDENAKSSEVSVDAYKASRKGTTNCAYDPKLDNSPYGRIAQKDPGLFTPRLVGGKLEVPDTFHDGVFRVLKLMIDQKWDGVTVHPFRGTIPTTGTMVAIDGSDTLDLNLDSADCDDKVKEWINNPQNKQILSREDAYLGAWVSKQTGKPVIEISRRIPDHAKAFELGRDFAQEGVFRLDDSTYHRTFGDDGLKETKARDGSAAPT